jgi:excisionase family DNA binding protein
VTRKRFNANKHEAAKAAKPVIQHELATIEEASVFLRVHVKTVRRRLKAGKLPGTKADGGQWRLPWAKLRELTGVS